MGLAEGAAAGSLSGHSLDFSGERLTVTENRLGPFGKKSIWTKTAMGRKRAEQVQVFAWYVLRTNAPKRLGAFVLDTEYSSS
jgi:hypothetical protein